MSFSLNFLFQLSKLCQQELTKRANAKISAGTENSLSANNCGTSLRDRSHRSTNRRYSSIHPLEKCDSSGGVRDVPEESLSSKKNPDTLNLGSEKFRCAKCSYVATSHSEYVTHARICKQVQGNSCPVCSEKFNGAELDDHIKSAHMTPDVFKQLDNGLYHCVKCNKSLKHFSQYKRHIGTLAHQGMDRCSSCGMLVPLKEMAEHQNKFHGKVRDGYLCKICGILFSSKMCLDRHITGVHAEREEYKCSECGLKFSRTDNLRRHQSTHSSSRQFVCCFCDLAFKSKRNLKAHINSIHFSKERYQCHLCFYVFNDEERRDFHIKMFHEGQEFHCQMCGQAFTNYSKKERHLQAHLNAFKIVNDPKRKTLPVSKRRSKVTLPTEKVEATEEEGSQNKLVEDSYLAVEDNQSTSSRSRKRKVSVQKNCENRSPNGSKLKKVKNEKKEALELSPLKAENRNSLSAKDSNLPKTKSGEREKTKHRKTKAGKLYEKSCLNNQNCPVQSAAGNEQDVNVQQRDLENVSFCECPDEFVSDNGQSISLCSLKPSVSIPEQTLCIYVDNRPEGDDSTIDSFSSLRPDSSITESTLFIDIDNIPQYESLNIDLTSADICPVEVEYLEAETDNVDTLDLVKAEASSMASDGLPYHIEVDVDHFSKIDESADVKLETENAVATILAELNSGEISLYNDEPPLKKGPCKMKPPKKSVPKQKSKRNSKSIKKYPDTGKKVIVKNLCSNDDAFVLPEFLIEEDED